MKGFIQTPHNVPTPLIIGELDDSDNLVKEHVRGLSLGGGIGGILYCKQGGSLYYYYYDGSWKTTTVKNDSVSLDSTPSNTCTCDENGNLTGRTKSLDVMILCVVLHCAYPRFHKWKRP